MATANKGLPRDIDVSVNISKPQAEITTDFSILCLASPVVPTTPGNERIRYYSSLSAVLEDFAVSSEPYKAAVNFFSQSPRSRIFAIGKINKTAQPGYLQGGLIANKTLEQWKAITNGSFSISIDGVKADITAITFASITTISGIAGAIQTAIRAKSASGTGFATATVVYDGGGIRITSGTTGTTSSVSFATATSPVSGVDLSGITALNLAQGEGGIGSGYVVAGYAPDGTIASELQRIRDAAMGAGMPVFGWALDASFRDSKDSTDACAWMEAQTYGIMGIVTNSPLAYDAGSTSDVGATMNTNGYTRSFCNYHNNPYYYPEVSALAYALSVDYSALNSTITMKFKDLRGIPTVPMDEAELGVLTNKRINTFTLTGNTSRTFREGVDSNPSWFIDDLINLDNFKELLQVAVYNVFLQNKKVPYNNVGVSLLYTAIAKVCDLFVYNGTFSSRPLSDAEAAAVGFTTDPAYTITFTPLGSMSASDRAKRVGPPCVVKVNLAGAMHSININVEAFA